MAAQNIDDAAQIDLEDMLHPSTVRARFLTRRPFRHIRPCPGSVRCGKAVHDGASVTMDRPYPSDRSSLTAAE
ncbi:hypothetical protein GCM10022221_25630 [Actinocorallia aurea]